MTNTIEWLVPHHVIHTSYSSDPDLPCNPDEPVLEWLNISSAETVHLIVDVHNLKQLPPTLQIMQLQWPRHPKIGWVVLVGAKSITMQATVQMAAQLFQRKHHFASTLTEAVQFLKSIDSDVATVLGQDN